MGYSDIRGLTNTNTEKTRKNMRVGHIRLGMPCFCVLQAKEFKQASAIEFRNERTTPSGATTCPTAWQPPLELDERASQARNQ